jgi:hexosaminidase
MLHRIAGADDISALATFAGVVESVKDYTRMDSLKAPGDNTAPLNRLVDAVSPESDVARRFGDFVQSYIQSGHKNQGAESQIRALLLAWGDDDAKLQPSLAHSFLLRELVPLSADLSALGAAGLLALDYLDKSEPSPESWRTQQLALVERAKIPKADLLLTVTTSVQQLIDATPVGHNQAFNPESAV